MNDLAKAPTDPMPKPTSWLGILARKSATFCQSPRSAAISAYAQSQVWLRQVRYGAKTRRAERYLIQQGVWPILVSGDSTEYKPEPWDLAFLHRAVRSKKPRVVLEFGSGYSTIVVAYALKQNKCGHLYSVEANERWLENTRRKLSPELLDRVELRFSRAELHTYDNQICSLFRTLPNVRPDLIYLDGPDPDDVTGSYHGLEFVCENGVHRSIVAADVLLYENTLRPGCMLVIDGRVNNTIFLINHLKRHWRTHFDRVMQHNVLILDRGPV